MLCWARSGLWAWLCGKEVGVVEPHSPTEKETSTEGNPSVATGRREDGYKPREAIDIL